jgi:WD40 repeat protein
MHLQRRISRRAVSLGLAGAIAGASAAHARQGISPYAEATPVEPAADALGWRIGEVTALDLEGAPCALSPDGQWLAGVGPDREFCIWSTVDLQPTLVPFQEAIDVDSIAWAPDSTAVAFGVEAFRHGIDGDIFVYELADETIRNLTDDGFDGGYFMTDETESFPIDVMPAWTADSQAVMFARSPWGDVESIPTDIALIPRAGGDVETLMSVEARPFSIFTPMRVLADGSIVYTFASSDVDDPMNGIWHLDPDGTTTLLVPGTSTADYPTPVLLDAWADSSELRVAALSAPVFNALDANRPWLFTWSSNEDEPVAIGPMDVQDPVRPFSACWSPDGGTMLVIGRLPQDQGETMETVGPVSELTILPEATGGSSLGPRWIRPFWSAGNTVFIPAIGGAPYLVTMLPVES